MWKEAHGGSGGAPSGFPFIFSHSQLIGGTSGDELAFRLGEERDSIEQVLGGAWFLCIEGDGGGTAARDKSILEFSFQDAESCGGAHHEGGNEHG